MEDLAASAFAFEEITYRKGSLLLPPESFQNDCTRFLDECAIRNQSAAGVPGDRSGDPGHTCSFSPLREGLEVIYI